GASNGPLRIVIAGVDASPSQVAAVVVDGSAVGIDSAAVSIDLGSAKPPSIGDAIDVFAGDAGMFKGEVVGVEPSFEGGSDERIVLRALNRLHRLTRGRRTRTFERQSDADIVLQIAGENGLAAGPPSPETSVPYDRVVQDDQTDLEFLLERAARIGFEVTVDDRTLVFRRPPDRIAATVGGGTS